MAAWLGHLSILSAIVVETMLLILAITREITQAGISTTRGHFGCIFTAIADCAT